MHLGLVVDQETKESIKHATIIIDGISKNITGTDRGEYWRLLVPGTYTIQAFAEGYAYLQSTITLLLK